MASVIPMSAFISVMISLFMRPVSAQEKYTFQASKTVTGETGISARAVLDSVLMENHG
jgi:hypothetical protein